MNRRERRNAARSEKGEFHENLRKYLRSDGPPQTTEASYCWLHKIHLENFKNPTERDRKIISSIRLVPFKRIEKGVMVMGRTCIRCGNTVYVNTPQTFKEGGLDGYTTEQKVDTISA